MDLGAPKNSGWDRIDLSGSGIDLYGQVRSAIDLYLSEV